MEEKIKKYLFKDGHDHEFEMLDLGDILNSKKELMTTPHRAQFHHILWIEKGKGTHYVDFNPIKIEDNTLIFIPHNCVNKFDIDGQYQGKAIIFTNSFFCKNNHDLQYLNSSMLFSDLYDIAKLKFSSQDSTLRTYLNTLETEYQRTSDESQYQILHNMLHVFLLQAEREMRKQGFKELKSSISLDYLLLFKELLEKNYKSERSVKKFASEICISEKQLNKATTTLLDKTPKQLIDERVILEAKRLLVHTTKSIKEVAYELCYEEPTNFIKYFKKHIEATPSEFRELNK